MFSGCAIFEAPEAEHSIIAGNFYKVYLEQKSIWVM